MLPVLKAAATDEVRLSEVVDRISDDFHLSDDEKSQRRPSGGQTTLANRTAWAKTYLSKAGLVSVTRRGYFKATERGKAILQKNPKRIDINMLRQFPEFQEFKSRQDGTQPT